MFSAVARVFRTPDLRRKMLVHSRHHRALPARLVHPGAVRRLPQRAGLPQQSARATTTCYGLVNLFCGGALLQLSVFALGIMPYITATIIVQLLRVVIPRFETLYKEGQSGQAKLTQYTRYLTIALGDPAVDDAHHGRPQRSAVQRLHPCDAHPERRLVRILLMVITMTAGTGLIMWSASSSPSAASATACRS